MGLFSYNKILSIRNPLFNIALLVLFVFTGSALAQEILTRERAFASQKYAEYYSVKSGKILGSFPAKKTNIIGVTVDNDKIIVSGSGVSVSSRTDNYFYRYSMAGEIIDSFPQPSATDGSGYMDLAFDGTYILASGTNEIKYIDTTNFQIHHSLPTSFRYYHSGLAFDKGKNTIWSMASTSVDLCEINSVTGAVIKSLPGLLDQIAGIALEKSTNPKAMNLWCAEPSYLGRAIRLTKIDTATGKFVFSYDLSSNFKANTLVGGLEIIENHSAFPGKTVALLVERWGSNIYFVELDSTTTLVPATITQTGSLGGWVNSAAIKGNYAFLAQADGVSVLDISTQNFSEAARLTLPAETDGYVVDGDYLYSFYPSYEDKYKNYLEIMKISNPLSPFSIKRLAIIGVNAIQKIAVSGDKMLVLATNYDTTKLLNFNVANPASISLKKVFLGPFFDMAVLGDYAYVLTGKISSPNENALYIYNIYSGFDFLAKIPIPGAEYIYNDAGKIHIACVNNKGYHIYDASVPTSPVYLGSIGIDSSSYSSVFASGKYTVLKKANSIMEIYDNSNPSNIKLLSSFIIGDFTCSAIKGNLLYITVNGGFKAIDITNPSAITNLNTPAIVTGISTKGNALYFADDSGKLMIFDISKPNTPVYKASLLINDINKVYCQGILMFVTDLGSKVYIYDLTDPLNPLYKSVFTARGRVLKIVKKGDFAFIITENSSKMDVISLSNIALPAKVAEYTFKSSELGFDIAVGDKKNNIYAITKLSGPNSSKLELVDISNPLSPRYINRKTGLARVENIAVIDDCILILENGAGYEWATLYTINPADTVEIKFTDQKQLSTKSDGTGLFVMGNYAFVSLITDQKLLIFSWDTQSKILFRGSTSFQPEPAETAGILAETPQTGFSAVQNNESRAKDIVEGYAYTVNGASSNTLLTGSKSTKITEITIPLEDVSSPNSATLTLGAISQLFLLCQSDLGAHTKAAADSGKYIIACNFFVSASTEDDWNLQSIKFKASGTGNELKDIQAVRLVLSSGLVLGVNSYSSDDGVITLPINQVLNRGTAKSFTLEYLFMDSLANPNQKNTYFVNLKAEWLTATPLVITTFEKLPRNELAGNTIIYGKLINYRNKTVYEKIQDGINDSQTTNADELLLCPCVFKENLIINKPITLRGRNVSERSEIQPSGDSRECMISVNADDFTFENLIFNGLGVTGNLIWVENKNLKTFMLWNNLFVNATYAIDFKDVTKSGSISGNTFKDIKLKCLEFDAATNVSIYQNNFTNSGDGISLSEGSENNQINANTFENLRTSIFLFNSSKNSIYDNQFKSGFEDYRQIRMRLKSTENQIYGNNSDTLYVAIVSEALGENEIYKNTMGGIVLSNSEKQKVYSNKVKYIMLRGANENSIYGNQVTNSVSHGITLAESNQNSIHDNEISECGQIGLYLGTDYEAGYNYKNQIYRNKIFKNKGSGIALSGSSYNTFYSNQIFENGNAGIDCWKGTFAIAQFNNFYDNIVSQNKYGISMSGTENCLIQSCIIKNNLKGGVEGHSCDNLKINTNDIYNQQTGGAGIALYGCNAYEITMNTILNNCKGINLNFCKTGKVLNNLVSESTCSNTGVWISESSPLISGNSIANNNGAGIYAELNSNPLVSGNNIFGNSGIGLNNTSPAVKINANGNWWGKTQGPGITDIAGSITASSWLSSPVLLGCTKENDTLYLVKGVADTTMLFLTNLSGEKDSLTITLSDEKGWLKGELKQKRLLDSSNVEIYLTCQPASGAADGTKNKITIRAEFKNSTLTDSLIAFAYTPAVNKIVLTPDTTTIQQGDSLKFFCFALDQQGKEIYFTPQWSSTKGRVDSLGNFYSDTAAGIAIVTATDSMSGTNGNSVVVITPSKPVLSKVIISPKNITLLPKKGTSFQVVGSNQFGYPYSFIPVWIATGGQIDNKGFYLADTIQGKFFVIVRDTVTGLADTAAVNITEAIPVELVSFSGKYTGKHVELDWKTATETNNMGFEILRSPRIEPLNGKKEFRLNEFVKAGYIAGKINSTSEVQYTFNDKTPLKNGIYKYRLKQIDLDGTASYSDVISIEIKVSSYVLEQNYPNPFNPVTNIEYSIPVTGKVTIEVYNVLGQRVSILKDEVEEAGNYKITWNGSSYASGVYIIRMESNPVSGKENKFISVRKMMLLK